MNKCVNILNESASFMASHVVNRAFDLLRNHEEKKQHKKRMIKTFRFFHRLKKNPG